MKTLSIIAIASLAAHAAQAQRIPVTDTKPEFDPSGPKAKAKEMRRVVQEFARCLARQSMSGVETYLSNNMDRLSPALGKRAPECLGNAYDEGDGSMLRGESSTFRVALAEAYVVRKYRDVGMFDVKSVAPLAHPDEANARGVHALGSLSECIVRTSPIESWTLLKTDAASPKETAAIAGLSPAMQACVTRGTTVKMPAFFLRGAIAETYYKLSQAPRLAVTGSAR